MNPLNTFQAVKNKSSRFNINSRLILICFITIQLFFAGSSLAQNNLKEFEQYLTDYQKNKNIPSISAGIAVENKIIWTGAKGFSDVENFVPATTNTVYRIASISKSITAVAIMQLVQQKKISLDDNALKYIPYFPTKKWKFTIRQLLNHTSGIRDYKFGEFNSTETFPSIRDAITLIIKDSLEYEPGTKYLYTTLGYNLLAAVIENVSGISYSEYMKQNVFVPSGMGSTYFEFQKEIVSYRARGYTKNLYRQFQNASLSDLSIKFAGGGIISTSSDLLKFGISLLEGKLITKTFLDTMFAPTRLKNGRNINYGLGFSSGVDDKGKTYFYHTGNGTGFSSQIVLYPTERIVSAYLTNCVDRNLGTPAIDLVNIFRDGTIPIPKIPGSDHLLSITLSNGIDSALVNLKLVQKDTVSNINSGEEELILFGNDLLNLKKYGEAIQLFKLIINDYPAYFKGFVGLGDAYYKDGNKGLALRNYRQALKLNPNNKYVTDMIKKLEGG